jgi:hypothetical protein
VAAVELVGSVGNEDERAHPAQAAGEMVEELSRGVVRPVDVLDQEQHAALRSRDREQGNDRLEQAKLRLARLASRLRHAGAELGEELRQLGPGRTEPLGQIIDFLRGQVVADRLDEGQVREGELSFAANAAQHGGAEPARLPYGLAREPCLADSGLAREHDQPPLSPPGFEQGILERRELLVAPHEHRAPIYLRHAGILAGPTGGL